jgi:hypothetical protein
MPLWDLWKWDTSGSTLDATHLFLYFSTSTGSHEVAHLSPMIPLPVTLFIDRLSIVPDPYVVTWISHL